MCVSQLICVTELAAVLLNLDTGIIEDQFHYYVRPTQNSILSSYCVNLTGIKQSLIRSQETFPVIYKKFIDWIQKLQEEKELNFTSLSGIRASDGRNATFCSWSDWDLGFYFRVECERLRIFCPGMLKAWIDVVNMFNVSVVLSVNLKAKIYAMDQSINSKIIFCFSFEKQKYHSGKCNLSKALQRPNIDVIGNAHWNK